MTALARQYYAEGFLQSIYSYIELQAKKSNLIDGATLLTVEDKLRHFRGISSGSFSFRKRKAEEKKVTLNCTQGL